MQPLPHTPGLYRIEHHKAAAQAVVAQVLSQPSGVWVTAADDRTVSAALDTAGLALDGSHAFSVLRYRRAADKNTHKHNDWLDSTLTSLNAWHLHPGCGICVEMPAHWAKPAKGLAHALHTLERLKKHARQFELNVYLLTPAQWTVMPAWAGALDNALQWTPEGWLGLKPSADASYEQWGVWHLPTLAANAHAQGQPVDLRARVGEALTLHAQHSWRVSMVRMPGLKHKPVDLRRAEQKASLPWGLVMDHRSKASYAVLVRPHDEPAEQRLAWIEQAFACPLHHLFAGEYLVSDPLGLDQTLSLWEKDTVDTTGAAHTGNTTEVVRQRWTLLNHYVERP